MAGKGGARPGAGRKKGGVNKKSKEIAEQAIKEGITPLEVMLKTMRYYWSMAEKANEDKRYTEQLTHMKEASSHAKDAAPYLHAKLQTTTLGSDPDKPLRVKSDVKMSAADSYKELLKNDAPIT